MQMNQEIKGILTKTVGKKIVLLRDRKRRTDRVVTFLEPNSRGWDGAGWWGGGQGYVDRAPICQSVHMGTGWGWSAAPTPVNSLVDMCENGELKIPSGT